MIDLREVNKLFKELGYERYGYEGYTDIISYMKVSSYKYKKDYKVTTDIRVNLLDKELRISTYYNRDGEIPRMIDTKIEPELYKAIDLLLKTVGII